MTDVLWFSDLGLSDLDQVGGKNASLGEMVRNLASAGVKVPDGFATTADAYRRFLSESGLDARIEPSLRGWTAATWPLWPALASRSVT